MWNVKGSTNNVKKVVVFLFSLKNFLSFLLSSSQALYLIIFYSLFLFSIVRSKNKKNSVNQLVFKLTCKKKLNLHFMFKIRVIYYENFDFFCLFEYSTGFSEIENKMGTLWDLKLRLVEACHKDNFIYKRFFYR